LGLLRRLLGELSRERPRLNLVDHPGDPGQGDHHKHGYGAPEPLVAAGCPGPDSADVARIAGTGHGLPLVQVPEDLVDETHPLVGAAQPETRPRPPRTRLRRRWRVERRCADVALLDALSVLAVKEE